MSGKTGAFGYNVDKGGIEAFRQEGGKFRADAFDGRPC
jgi:hypothetical protein